MNRAAGYIVLPSYLTAVLPLLAVTIHITAILILSTGATRILSTLLTTGSRCERRYATTPTTHSRHILDLTRHSRPIPTTTAAGLVSAALVPVAEEGRPCHHFAALLTPHQRQYVRLRVHSE